VWSARFSCEGAPDDGDKNPGRPGEGSDLVLVAVGGGPAAARAVVTSSGCWIYSSLRNEITTCFAIAQRAASRFDKSDDEMFWCRTYADLLTWRTIARH
jgi:hypothetical protein